MQNQMSINGSRWPRLHAVALCLLALEGQAAETMQSTEDKSSIDYSISETVTYDDNLYRLPSDLDPQLAVGENTEREDFINRASLGTQIHWLLGRQTFDVNLRADDNRYRHNDMLDHVSGNGTAAWRWVFGHSWSGRIGAIYDRSLAAFANNRFLGKDMLTNTDYFLEVKNQLTPRWNVTAAGHSSRIEHSASAREVENQRSEMGSFGITYETPQMNAYGASYRYTKAEFPDSDPSVSGFDRDYDETAPRVWLRYAFTEKTDIDAHIGYLERDYPNAEIGDFSGEFWRATLTWNPTAKISVAVAGWRELQAYIEAGSDYFESEGYSISPAWMPTNKWTFSLQYSHDDERFIGSNPVPLGQPRRHDRVSTSTLAARYEPQEWLELGATYRYEQRSSNRDLLDYYDNLMSVSAKLKF
jgi:exopolysaccharide biosynthesis operon protein EpsL